MHPLPHPYPFLNEGNFWPAWHGNTVADCHARAGQNMTHVRTTERNESQHKNKLTANRWESEMRIYTDNHADGVKVCLVSPLQKNYREIDIRLYPDGTYSFWAGDRGEYDNRAAEKALAPFLAKLSRWTWKGVA